MDPKTILIGNDHGGYDLAVQVLEYLKQKGIPAEHVGCRSTEIVRYCNPGGWTPSPEPSGRSS